MPRPRDLQCPSGCSDGTFEALNAPLIVDRQGRYVSHDSRAASYRCTSCGSIAVDLWAAAREMQHDRSANPPTLMCPACGTLMLPPVDDPLAAVIECPACGQQFTVEEGMPHLHRGAITRLDDGSDADEP